MNGVIIAWLHPVPGNAVACGILKVRSFCHIDDMRGDSLPHQLAETLHLVRTRSVDDHTHIHYVVLALPYVILCCEVILGGFFSHNDIWQRCVVIVSRRNLYARRVYASAGISGKRLISCQCVVDDFVEFFHCRVIFSWKMAGTPYCHRIGGPPSRTMSRKELRECYAVVGSPSTIL